jgi:glycosyltransferase involved in cell wall biosynthesis
LHAGSFYAAFTMRDTLMLGSDRSMLLLEPGAAARSIPPGDIPVAARRPLISCIMASRGRPYPARLAIDCYRRQSYAPRELIIATAAEDGRLGAEIAAIGDPSIRLLQVKSGATVGGLRNAAIAASSGQLLAIWDDDDLSHPERLAVQHQAMLASKAQGCFLARVLLWWPERQMLAVSCPRTWENSMLVERENFPAYPGNQPRGEDTLVATALRGSHRLVLHDVPEAYCYVAHGDNLWHAEHFEMLFRVASRRFTGAAYEGALSALSADMPMVDYAAGLPST